MASMNFDGVAGSRGMAGITYPRSFTFHPQSVICTSRGFRRVRRLHQQHLPRALCTCNARFASVGERFQWRRVLLLSVYSIPRSIQRGAFFLTLEGRKEGSARSTIRLLSCTNTLSVLTRPSHH